MDPSGRSNWWYGVAIPASLELIGWVALQAASTAGFIGEGANALVLLLPAFAIIAGFFLIPVFAFSLYMDARILAKSPVRWTPNPYLWGIGGLLLPVVGLIGSSYSFMVLIATFYLYRRFKYAAPVVTAEDDTIATANADSRTDIDHQRNETGQTERSSSQDTASRPLTKWWYGVAIPVALYPVLWAAVVGIGVTVASSGGSLEDLSRVMAGISFVLVLLAIVTLVAIVLLTPVFSVSIYMDAKAIRASGAKWQPNRYVYAGIALFHLSSLLLAFPTLVTFPAGVFYLYRRHKYVGTP